MKKITILSSIFTITFASTIFTADIESLNQQREQAEQAFRETYKHLDIPKMVPDYYYAYLHTQGHFEFTTRHYDFFSNPFGKFLEECFISPFLPCKPAIAYAAEENKINDFALLHEVGHYDLSKTLPIKNITPISVTTGIAAMMLCGKHRKMPYKNIATKAISKSIAGLSATCLSSLSLLRFHEIYADNYACKHIKDRKGIKEAISYFKKMDEKFKSFYKESSGPETLMGYNFFQFYHDPVHPSPLSRAQKIEHTLQQRFGLNQ